MSFRAEQELARIVSGINLLADKLALVLHNQEKILAGLAPTPVTEMEMDDPGPALDQIPFLGSKPKVKHRRK